MDVFFNSVKKSLFLSNVLKTIMFTSQTGACKYFNGITNIAVPYVRSACFEPAYQNAYTIESESKHHNHTGSGSLLCTPIPSTPQIPGHFRGACAFDQECGPTDICQGGLCQKASSFDARNSVWRREYSRIVGYAPRSYTSPDGQQCRAQPYYVLDETGKRKVVCPILNSNQSQPQCNTCIQSLFNCNRFRESNPAKYKQCLAMERSIHYNIVTPNGQLIPMGAEMDGPGMKVMDLALKKCGHVCGSCSKQ